MKVKQLPADFVVEERADLTATDEGRFSVYKLRKEGIGTLEALRALRRAWRVGPREVGFGGLKDRHAVTVQWVTIHNGPRRNLEEKAFRLTYEGRSDVPMSRMVLSGNAFRIRLRDLSREEAERLAARLAAVAAAGLPSYFDDQRFGSLRGGGGFSVLHLLRGDPEAALKAVIASPSREDRGAVRERKKRIRAAWADLESVIGALAGSPMRNPALHLVKNPGDFEGAFATLDREERRLYASAWQSAVWNRAVCRRVSELVGDGDRIAIPSPVGALIFPKDPGVLAAFEGQTLPLPAPKAKADDPAWQAALEAALAEDGLTLDRLELSKRVALDLRPTKRAILFRPDEAVAKGPLPDELSPGRSCLDLSFSLGRGLYATLLLKRLSYDIPGPKSFA